MSDNPFIEPEDSERTVIRPMPGGRRAAAADLPVGVAEPPPRRAAAAVSPDGVETLAMGLSPLVAAAAPLLQLMMRLRNTVNQPDPGDLRERAVQAMRRFEQQSRDSGVPIELLRPAHYALCASLDDVVLKQMRQSPGGFLPVIELMYLCMSLGFQGRYRLSPRGPAELDRLREETYALILRQRQLAEPELSPHWKGLAAPYRGARPTVPIWVGASVALAILAGLFVWFSTTLNASSDSLFARLLNAPPDHMPAIARAAPVVPVPAAAQPAPAATDPLCDFLKPEVDQGLVSVMCTPPTPLVRIKNRGMFASGSATVEARFFPLLDRIANGLKDEPGQVQIVGYTDNQPIRNNLKFPSNFQLSLARAQAAKAIIDRKIGDSSRTTAEGRGESDPLAPNTTAEGREENRRIEIVLHRPQ